MMVGFCLWRYGRSLYELCQSQFRDISFFGMWNIAYRAHFEAWNGYRLVVLKNKMLLSLRTIFPKPSIFPVICQCGMEEEAQLQQTVAWDQQKIYQLFTQQYPSHCQTVLASALLGSARISWVLLYLTQTRDLFSFALPWFDRQTVGTCKCECCSLFYFSSAFFPNAVHCYNI